MRLSLIGVSHKSSPLAVRERLAARGAKAALEALLAEGWREAVVLSTCNRFEVYAAAPDGAEGRLRAFFERIGGPEAAAGAYGKDGTEAARHLFEVAAGLDSLVVGEAEILGQVKQAYELARSSAATGRLTNVLFQRALYAGKAARSRTALGSGHVSVASVAVELARRIFGRLESSEVLLLGAGTMAEKTARHLKEHRVARLHLANRTWEKARGLAALIGAEPSRWEDFPALLERVDVVVASTGSPEPVLSHAQVAAAAAQRRGRPLFLIDIAMPRDVAEDAAGVEGVYLYQLAHLESIAAENVRRRAAETAAASAIIEEQAAEFGRWLGSLESGEQFSFRHSTLKPVVS